MTVNRSWPRSLSRLSIPAIVLALGALAACEDGVRTAGGTLTRDFDGSWSFDFASTTPVAPNGAPCLDGTGRVTVEGGRVVGATFAELQGVVQSMGALEGRILKDEAGMVMTIASSQGGRNAFVARGAETADGFSGTWEDIDECSGTFSAVRAPDAGPGSS